MKTVGLVFYAALFMSGIYVVGTLAALCLP